MMKLSFLHNRKPFPAQADYEPVLDGFRSIFVFLVAWFHIWQQSWLTPHAVVLGRFISLDPLLRSGYIWVDAMLLLSGFVLFLPYALHPEKQPEQVTHFYWKRFTRIYPSYALAVLVFFVWHREGYGGDVGAMLRDLAAHLSMTHIFFFETYYGSPINGALWTVGVEWWFYLLFPWILRLWKKRPVCTGILMAAIAFVFRFFAGLADSVTAKSMLFNQLPAFLDVYLLGFIGAGAYAALKKQSVLQKSEARVFFTLLCCLMVILLRSVVLSQAACSGTDAIRQGQMDNRFVLCAGAMCLMVAAAYSLKGVRIALGSRVMAFLASVSYWFYMIHQPIAAHMRQDGWLPSVSDMPNQAGEYSWQLPFSLLAFLIPLAISAVMTYGFEKPVRKLLSQCIHKS